MRQGLKQFGISLLTYCITSNHTHLLIKAKDRETVSSFMQKLEGEFAEYYNLRKRRSGAFWGGRYHCTMIDGGKHLSNCMKYIDLNMVRAGVVKHPGQWCWCGFRELVGERKRYRLVDMEQVIELYDGWTVEDFAKNYRQVIEEVLERRELSREPMWTETIAVGSEEFVRGIGEKTQVRMDLKLDQGLNGQWTLRESRIPYN